MVETARIEAHLPLVRRIAGEVRRSLSGSVEVGDLIGYGTEGLIEALDRFDPKRGFAFSTFAYYRIRGAMWDGVRKMNWRTIRRADREKARFEHGANLALQQTHDEAPPAGSADEAGSVERAITSVAASFFVSFDLETLARQPSAEPNAEVQAGDRGERALVRAALVDLPEKERTLIEQMYFEDKSLTDAGAAIGLSKSWACRLHARALKLLAEALAARGLEATQPGGSARR